MVMALIWLWLWLWLCADLIQRAITICTSNYKKKIKYATRYIRQFMIICGG